jgi:MtrB/PioB family decaheme-associated outer membrane protein
MALGLFLTAGLSCQAPAEDTTSADQGEDEPSILTGTFEYGPGYVSDDSYRFGRYTGLEEEGLFVNGGFDVHFRPGRPDYLHLQGYDLGLDSRRLSVEYGKQGNYETRLQYRELPSFKMDSAQTPYQNPGHDNLVVAPGGSPTVLRPFELDTKRKRLSGGISYFPRKDWKTTLDFSHEKKDGTDWIGGALLGTTGGPGTGGGYGRTYAVILPEPIDQTTTEVDANLEYNGEQSQWRLNLHASLFDNDYDSLRWENPGFDTSDFGGGGGGGGGVLTLPGQGQLALAPDNQFYQLSLSGATRLSDTTRFTGALSVGLMQQDEDFLPYGIDGSPAATKALPRSSLDGEVWLYSARAGITARPVKPLRLKAQYRYDERDNDTPQETYTYDRMDSGSTSQPIENEPLSYKKHKLILDANYRFSPEWSGSAGYQYRDTDRDYSDVEKSTEHSGKAGLKWRPRDDFDASLRLGTSTRDASGYEKELENQNPLLRKYTLADRDRDQAGLLLNYAPAQNLNIGFSADLMEDDYTDSDLGLTDADSHNYNLDVSYFPAQDIRLNAFYSHERIESRQLGLATLTTADAFYKVDYDDKIDTLGLGAHFDNVWKELDLGINYRYSKGTGEIDYTGLSPGLASNSYPDLENELHHIELSAAYDLKSNTRVKFSAIYESMRTDDWALDGIPPYPDRQLLTLGNDTEEYDVFAFMVALQHRF